MARFGHAANPRHVRAQARALAEEIPPEALQRRMFIRHRSGMAVLSLLSVFLLVMSFAPFDQGYLGYVALVPWLMVVSDGQRRREPILWATLTGVAFWLATLHWLWWITLVGYFALVVYLSLYWLVAAVVLRAAMRRNWPMWIVLPVVWVALEYLRAYVISGFPWFYLAQSQYRMTTLIQISDLTGQYGVSFFVAMVNGAIADALLLPLFAKTPDGGGKVRGRNLLGLAAAAGVLAGLLGYGTYRLGQDTRSPGPVVGVVQEQFPISLWSYESPARIVAGHLSLTRWLVGTGCDAVVWPETMLPTGSNEGFLTADFNDPNAYSDAVVGALAAKLASPTARATYGDRVIVEDYRERIRALLGPVAAAPERLGCPLIAGGGTWHVNPRPLGAEDLWLRQNSTLIFDSRRRGEVVYSKQHLVPFGEYVPFRDAWPGLHRFLRGFVPDSMPQMHPGQKASVFRLGKADANEANAWTVATPICFEGTISRVCRSLAYADGRKRADVLMNLSNDGWFVWPGDSGPPRGSTEHAQHLVHYVFRAIENRVPVVRAVNTGISASIDSDGRIVAELHTNGQRTMIPGVLLMTDRPEGVDPSVQVAPRVLVDERESLYSTLGDAFAQTVSLVAAALVVALMVSRRRRKHALEAKESAT